VVSIFEPHTDIIRKDRRDTLYGHMVFLTGGASGLIVDCFVERGNPSRFHEGSEARRACDQGARQQTGADRLRRRVQLTR
jgi:hypothetical protein